MLPEACVFVVDDDSAVRDSLTSLLQNHGLSAECYASAAEFVAQVDRSRRGCLVLDLRMPGMSGLQLLQRLASDNAMRPTVIITANAEIETVVQSMQLGAVDFLEKPFHPAKLLQAVRSAMESEQRDWLQSEQLRQSRSRIQALSSDEKIVLAGIVRGLTNQQIADECDISLRTVQFRRSSLFSALGITSRAELVALVQKAEWPIE